MNDKGKTNDWRNRSPQANVTGIGSVEGRNLGTQANKKGVEMTIFEILQEAIQKAENWFDKGPFAGGVNWNYMDADLWTHPDAGNFTDQQLFDGFEEFARAHDPRPDITDKWRAAINSI